ncbi:MAG TPA: glycosyltransferase [Gemmatimonadales bacterium]|jgi:glycosyltransferase involved in cell wall biosynthesis|nr:glycosyltransferase [Gemmatimonadales bacterium]
MTFALWLVLSGSLGLCLYAYVGYPAILKLLSLLRGAGPHRRPPPFGQVRPPSAWPRISITIPVHNEAAVIVGTLERVLDVQYPAGLRQILVVSDASTDGTDDIVRRFAARGVELLRLPERRGKTAAENAARSYLTGDIIVNTDASVRIDRDAVVNLVAAFADPSIGVASGRDVSVASLDARANPGEHAYVGYEMWVRDLETQVAGIVGASGCLYAIRKDLHVRFVPEHLSRDFGAALVAREQGYRAVSVPAAICYVPRSPSLRSEYRRKVRTMARGLRTLWHKRALLNPMRHGLFAWMLWSHKLCRWLTPWAFLLTTAMFVALAPWHWWAAATLACGGAVALVTAIGWMWSETRRMPRLIALPAYALSGNFAALQAWIRALSRDGTALWEPTRRSVTSRPAGRASPRA